MWCTKWICEVSKHEHGQHFIGGKWAGQTASRLPGTISAEERCLLSRRQTLFTGDSCWYFPGEIPVWHNEESIFRKLWFNRERLLPHRYNLGTGFYLKLDTMWIFDVNIITSFAQPEELEARGKKIIPARIDYCGVSRLRHITSEKREGREREADLRWWSMNSFMTALEAS